MSEQSPNERPIEFRFDTSGPPHPDSIESRRRRGETADASPPPIARPSPPTDHPSLRELGRDRAAEDIRRARAAAKSLADAARPVRRAFDLGESRAYALEREKLGEKHAVVIDDFIRWAYSDKPRRRAPFDASGFASSAHDRREVGGITTQAVRTGYLIFDGIADSKVEADNRSLGLIRRGRRDGPNLVRFTDAGRAQGRRLLWLDRTIWLNPIRRRWRAICWIAAAAWIVASGTIGLFGGVREFVKFVRHPVHYLTAPGD